jgi:hypothetical protein
LSQESGAGQWDNPLLKYLAFFFASGEKLAQAPQRGINQAAWTSGAIAKSQGNDKVNTKKSVRNMSEVLRFLLGSKIRICRFLL